MPEFKDKLDNYLNDELGERSKEELYYSLVNEDPETMAEEQELENLLALSFSSIDVTQSVLNELKKSDAKPVSEFALNIVDEIKQKPQKAKTKPMNYIWLSLAAALIIGFILLSLPQKHVNERVNKLPELPDGTAQEKLTSTPTSPPEPLVISSITEQNKQQIESGDLVSGEGLLNLPEGVKIRSYGQTEYTFKNQLASFIKMNKGKTLVDVESRKGKEPLYFDLPHGQVEVVGTQFELLASKDSSSVSVTEGVVNYHAQGKSLSIEAGQSGVSTDHFIKASFNLPGTQYHASFDSRQRLNSEFNDAKLSKGLSGEALELNQKSGYPVKLTSGSNSRSLSFWFNAKELNSKKRFILRQFDLNKTLEFYMEGDFLCMQTITQKQEPRLIHLRVRYGWHHVVLNQTGNKYTFYLNGINIKKGSMPVFSQQHFLIGAANGNGFIGKLDELRIFQRSLKHDEVLKLKEEQKLSKRLN